MTTNHNKGKINDNAYAALVRSDLFMPKKEKPKKGRGSYKRSNKHKSDHFEKRISKVFFSK